MNEVPFFVKRLIDQRDLLRFFERELGLSCDSILHPKDTALAFLMTIEHDEGFRHYVYLFWREGPVFDKSLAQLAQIFADEFATEILFESESSIADTSAEEWQLAVPGGSGPAVVTVIELADGIDVANTSCSIVTGDPLMPSRK
ncbi:hypothetical protein INH39_21890 [Massilia violaceinigra]|uniref:Uncharacterized protein n=1 Tax=Massilia violaceinigra TaxID=2045208 RepID=A0ABY4A0G3_9BURK|nr:hypothetical protein [Massilia violaceinigra]UOD28107.1 hypothetical protein INH39_21890 [Massilia violaceinigra]